MANYIQIISNLSHDTKYLKWYCQIVTRAGKRASTKQEAKKLIGYVESHHILPKSFNLGGGTDLLNIVHLTPREHFLCHLLLTKMLINKDLVRKMKKAFTYMQTASKKHPYRYVNSNFYAYTRACYIEAVSKEGNPRFGKIGTFSGRTHSEESKLKMSISRTGKSSPKKGKPSPLKGRVLGKYSEERILKAKAGLLGMKFYTNGIKDIKLKPDENIPEGFYPGRTNGVHKAVENITNWNKRNAKRTSSS